MLVNPSLTSMKVIDIVYGIPLTVKDTLHDIFQKTQPKLLKELCVLQQFMTYQIFLIFLLYIRYCISIHNAKDERDPTFVLGGRDECTVAMARSCAAFFITRLLPVIINEPCRSLTAGKKPSMESKLFVYHCGSFFCPLFLHNPDTWIPARVRVEGNRSELLGAGRG